MHLNHVVHSVIIVTNTKTKKWKSLPSSSDIWQWKNQLNVPLSVTLFRDYTAQPSLWKFMLWNQTVTDRYWPMTLWNERSILTNDTTSFRANRPEWLNKPHRQHCNKHEQDCVCVTWLTITHTTIVSTRSATSSATTVYCTNQINSLFSWGQCREVQNTSVNQSNI